ncbi:hypothetical protein, partial [Kingella oralis]|uniref:hypothetical protein n=1 Tax=Kingella oralis TaxID=505 RepID=UPI002009E9CA
MAAIRFFPCCSLLVFVTYLSTLLLGFGCRQSRRSDFRPMRFFAIGRLAVRQLNQRPEHLFIACQRLTRFLSSSPASPIKPAAFSILCVRCFRAFSFSADTIFRAAILAFSALTVACSAFAKTFKSRHFCPSILSGAFSHNSAIAKKSFCGSVSDF